MSVRNGKRTPVGQTLNKNDVAMIRRSWDELYELLAAYKQKHGDTNVPLRYEVDPSFGYWVCRLRREKHRLHDEQLDRLTQLNFVFECRNERNERIWNEKFERLKVHLREFGSGSPPDLSSWVGAQRYQYKCEKLSTERILQLNQIGFEWVASTQRRSQNIFPEKWYCQYVKLKRFHKEHGHSNVPYFYKKEPSLGFWVQGQRVAYKDKRLSEDQKVLLTDLGFVWKMDKSQSNAQFNEMRFEKSFIRLVQFKQVHGHPNVSQRGNDAHLGLWLKRQRAAKRAGLLDPVRFERLSSLGVKWTEDPDNEDDNDSTGVKWTEDYDDEDDSHSTGMDAEATPSDHTILQLKGEACGCPDTEFSKKCSVQFHKQNETGNTCKVFRERSNPCDGGVQFEADLDRNRTDKITKTVKSSVRTRKVSRMSEDSVKTVAPDSIEVEYGEKKRSFDCTHGTLGKTPSVANALFETGSRTYNSKRKRHEDAGSEREKSPEAIHARPENGYMGRVKQQGTSTKATRNDFGDTIFSAYHTREDLATRMRNELLTALNRMPFPWNEADAQACARETRLEMYNLFEGHLSKAKFKKLWSSVRETVSKRHNIQLSSKTNKSPESNA